MRKKSWEDNENVVKFIKEVIETSNNTGLNSSINVKDIDEGSNEIRQLSPFSKYSYKGRKMGCEKQRNLDSSATIYEIMNPSPKDVQAAPVNRKRGRPPKNNKIRDLCGKNFLFGQWCSPVIDNLGANNGNRSLPFDWLKSRTNECPALPYKNTNPTYEYSMHTHENLIVKNRDPIQTNFPLNSNCGPVNMSNNPNINSIEGSIMINHMAKVDSSIEAVQSIRTPIMRDNSNNKEVFTDKEILSLLNLRTLTFFDMPPHPIKVGEASFSEVFLADGLIYKIIPFSEWYSIESFSKEVFIMECLKEYAGVCQIKNSFLLTGGFSNDYLKAWENFKNSENIHPLNYTKNHLFGVIVMNDCGTDLEKYVFKSANEIISFIRQLLVTIVILEEDLKFEHRDMHWGNVMIKDGYLYLIDFNFSRLETDKIVYTDLNKESWLFEGDVASDIQFGVYGSMKESCKSDWKSFNSTSNILWVRYILRKLESKTVGLDFEENLKVGRLLKRLIFKAYECVKASDYLMWFNQNIMV